MARESLLFAKPELAKEWHPTKNGSLTPRDVSPGSHKKVWWKCIKGHEWQAVVYSRSTGKGCPHCPRKIMREDNCLQTVRPELAREWHPTKNGVLTPVNVAFKSRKKVWWICNNKGHEWLAKVADRSYGTGCPYCSGRTVCEDNCLQTVRPELAQEWHPTKNGNLTPRDITPFSHKKVWWICDKGHEWQAPVSNRSNGQGCKYCAGKAVCEDNCLQTVRPELAQEWHPTKNGNLTPRDVTPGSNRKIWWVCNRGHEWQAMVYSRIAGNGCPKCHSAISELELRTYCELKYLFHSTQSRAKVHGMECDIFIPELSLGIEIDSLYWHRNRNEQDKEKAATLSKHGITLINVREIGLKKISDTDILFSPDDGQLEIIKRIVRLLRQQLNISDSLKETVDDYLKKGIIANDSEYKELWDRLPSPLPSNSLLEQYPYLAQEWHPTKNGSLTPRDVSPGSHKKVWWKCNNKGHEWAAVVYSRIAGNNCPYCSGRQRTRITVLR